MLKHRRFRFSDQSMRAKLFFSFSTAIIIIFLLIMAILYRVISERYRTRVIYSASQSFDQAHSFMQNYISNMHYASEFVYYNGDLQRILTAEDFKPDRDYAVQYREFLTLNQVLSSSELNESIYRARIFIPNEITYANHSMHFAPNSELESRNDYEEFLANPQSERLFFTKPEEVNIPGRLQPVRVVSLLRTIRSVDGTATPIAVVQISILTSRLQSIIEKSNITTTGLVYLMNEAGDIISASKSGEALLQSLINENALSKYSDTEGWKGLSHDGSQYLVNRVTLGDARWTLTALIPEAEIKEQSQQISVIILILTLAAVIAVFVISYLIARYYTNRLKRLAIMMDDVKKGSLYMRYDDPSGDEIGELFRAFTYMTERLETLMHEQYKSGKAVKSAQFSALQAQINPHFLYNTLDLINWEAMDRNAPEVADIAQTLARFYRISLNKGKQIVTIQHEIHHVESYVDIQNRHFENAIKLTVNVPENIMKLACINFILQPLVENSITHNLVKDMTIQECEIIISAQLSEGVVLCTVSDDGVGMTEKQIAEVLIVDVPDSVRGYGVKNINARIRLCFGEDYGLSYRSELGHGTAVTIRIPALTVVDAEKIV